MAIVSAHIDSTSDENMLTAADRREAHKPGNRMHISEATDQMDCVRDKQQRSLLYTEPTVTHRTVSRSDRVLQATQCDQSS